MFKDMNAVSNGPTSVYLTVNKKKHRFRQNVKTNKTWENVSPKAF